jgi:hypothetical protein
VVSGGVNVTPTAAAATDLDMSVPVASSMSANQHAGGTAFCFSPSIGAAIFYGGNPGKVRMHFTATSTASQYFAFSFMYQVI